MRYTIVIDQMIPYLWQFIDVIAVYIWLPSSPVKKSNKLVARHDQLHSQSLKVDEQAVIIALDSSPANMTTTGKEFEGL